tara:strand:+ start:5200 stop:5499 length:300 start_codon:yes stop_codon:yes gene_type:complete
VKKNIFKFLKSTLGLIIIIFTIWMIFFDSNSLIVHFRYENEILNLKNKKEYYLREIENDNKELKMIESDSGIEKYAREKLFMKKEQEDIFIIEFDTISQ